jgi:hypothetical protein
VTDAVEIKTLGFTSFVKAAQSVAGEARWRRVLDNVRELTRAVIERPPKAGWMSAEPYYALLDAFVWFGFDGQTEPLREVGRRQVDGDLRGVYRFLVRLTTPEFVASRASVVYSSYWRNQGSLRTELRAPGEVDVVYVDFPVVRPLFVHTQAGAILAAVNLTRAKGTKVVLLETSQHGFRMRATWQ